MSNYNPAVIELKKLMGKHGISSSELSLAIKVTAPRIYEILSGRRRITADSDIRLCKFFRKTNGFFIYLQIDYDLDLTFQKLSSKLTLINDYETIKKVRNG